MRKLDYSKLLYLVLCDDLWTDMYETGLEVKPRIKSLVTRGEDMLNSCPCCEYSSKRRQYRVARGGSYVPRCYYCPMFLGSGKIFECYCEDRSSPYDKWRKENSVSERKGYAAIIALGARKAIAKEFERVYGEGCLFNIQ